MIGDIRAQLGALKPVAICLDTLNRSFTGSESSDEDMTNYVRAADALGEAFGCLVVLVHHSPHDGNRPRGHSSLMGAADVQIGIRRDSEENVVAEIELAKDMEVGLVFVSRLERVELGRDEDGDPVASCVIREIDEAAAIAAAKRPEKRRKLSKAAQIALRALHEAIGEYGEIPHASNRIPPNAKTVSVDRWRETAIAIGISTGEDRAQRAAFQRGVQALVADGKAAIWQIHAWPA
jgi:hypothetical protein